MSPGNTLGGTAVGAGNVISANGGDGADIDSNGNLVAGNLIGTNAAGTAELGNGIAGLSIQGGSNQILRNVVSGNGATGIAINTSGNVVQGNRIGTNAAVTGTIANGGDGIILLALCDDGICTPSSHNSIGGTQTGAGNIISGNLGNGVHVDGTGLGVSNTVQGNRIGTDQAGAASLGNGANGVFLSNNAVDDNIGGEVAGAGNVIAHNGASGVLVGASSADTTRSAVQQNTLFGNGGLGIDLAPRGTVTCSANPPGSNGDTACPTITGASVIQMSGTGCAGCTIEVFVATNEANDQGHGEGATFLGRTTASPSGAWILHLASGQISSGQRVTATATTPVSFNHAAETSEFAANATVS